MNPPLVLFLYFTVAACGLAYAAATVLIEVLAGPWRRSSAAPWPERARLAHAPGLGVIALAALLPPLLSGIGGGGLQFLAPEWNGRLLGFWAIWMAALAGVLTVRFQWLRQLWGPRVSVRSWLAGLLVLVFALVPHLLIAGLLLVLLPETPARAAAGMFCGAVLALGFFAFGGSIVVLRALGVIRPAPPRVAEMVDKLAIEMKVPGAIRVFELNWPQVNAVAWGLYRAVGFSRPLLQVMAPDEVRAVAAHELAHLLESPRVRAARLVHMFAYLPVVPLIKYGGAGGLALGYLLILGIMFGYRRFTRRLEQRADRLEHEAIADTGAYARSMSKLYEANVMPAVMPGTPSHPHLYDRLLAAGIQPAFPRPTAPSRAKPLLTMLLVAFVATALLFGIVLALAFAARNRP